MVSKPIAIGILAIVSIVVILMFGKPFGLYQIGGTFLTVSPYTTSTCGNNICEQPWESGDICSDCRPPTTQLLSNCGAWSKLLDGSIKRTCDPTGGGVAVDWTVSEADFNANVLSVCTPKAPLCNDWSVCDANNKQTRSCDDGCLITVQQQTCGATQPICTFSCGAWSGCNGNTETRICNDNCGNTRTESRSCGITSKNFYDRQNNCAVTSLDTNMPADSTRYFDDYNKCINFVGEPAKPGFDPYIVGLYIILGVIGYLAVAYFIQKRHG